MVQLFHGNFTRVFISVGISHIVQCTSKVITYGTLLFYGYTALCSIPLLLPGYIKCSNEVLDFGGRFRQQHFTHDVAPTLDSGQQLLSYGVAAYAVTCAPMQSFRSSTAVNNAETSRFCRQYAAVSCLDDDSRRTQQEDLPFHALLMVPVCRGLVTRKVHLSYRVHRRDFHPFRSPLPSLHTRRELSALEQLSGSRW